jgi:CRISPR-associated protein (TIGR02584 family)
MTQTILLAVTGMSPAILTETVWALAHPGNGTEAVLPSRIVAVTTASGRDRLATLFVPSHQLGGLSPWEALRRALQDRGHDLRDRLRFGTTREDIRVLTTIDPITAQTLELDDLRTPADNEAASDFILETVRGFVENPDCHLVASLAGGRKTMGALLYACLSLIGRETDRLTHVLVNEPFEALPGFWFPGQPGGPIPRVGRDGPGESLPADRAVVQLADVPFVPLRNLFQRELGQPVGSFQRLLERCRVNVRVDAGESLRLEIETRKPCSWINGRMLELGPREHLVLLHFARRARSGEPILAAYDEALTGLDETRLEVRASAPPNDWSDWRHSASLDAVLTERDLVRILSDIRQKARRCGGDAALLASVLPSRGRCALEIPAPMIFLR